MNERNNARKLGKTFHFMPFVQTQIKMQKL